MDGTCEANSLEADALACETDSFGIISGGELIRRRERGGWELLESPSSLDPSFNCK
jgi:hypothetical protein